jgi:hypothetical protein
LLDETRVVLSVVPSSNAEINSQKTLNKTKDSKFASQFRFLTEYNCIFPLKKWGIKCGRITRELCTILGSLAVEAREELAGNSRLHSQACERESD